MEARVRGVTFDPQPARRRREQNERAGGRKEGGAAGLGGERPPLLGLLLPPDAMSQENVCGHCRQPITAGSSQPYELCPHIPSQCDAKDTILANTYSSKQQKEKDIEKTNYFTNQPYRVNLTDNAVWSKLKINSTKGTVCSYKFDYQDSMENIYQIMIKDFSNLDIGLYFFSRSWDGIVDYKIFDSSDCDKMKYCEVISNSDGKGLIFSMDET